MFCKSDNFIKTFKKISANGKNITNLENCSLCESTSLEIRASPSSLAQSSNFSIHFLSAANLARPASLKFSNSKIVPRNANISYKKKIFRNINNLNIAPLLMRQKNY